MSSLPTEKVCSTCNEPKPINQDRNFKNGFYVRADSPDGYRHQCKECYTQQRNELAELKRIQAGFAPRPRDSVGVSPDLVPDLRLIKLEPETKVCTVCDEEKPLEAFHKHPKGKHGRHSICKVCRLEAAYQQREETK